jgi:hypothetical protein
MFRAAVNPSPEAARKTIPVPSQKEMLYENDSFGFGSVRDFGGCPYERTLCDVEPTDQRKQGHPSDS